MSTPESMATIWPQFVKMVEGSLPEKELPEASHHDGQTQPVEVDQPERVERPTVRVPRLRDSDLLEEWEARQ